MGLDERQKQQALKMLMSDAANNGVDLTELDQQLSSLKPHEFDTVLDNAFVSAHQEIKKNAVSSAIIGAGDSATFGMGEKLLAGMQAAVDPEETYKQKLSQLQDEHQVARISNPTSYTIGNIAGYFTGFGELFGQAGRVIGAEVAGGSKVVQAAVQAGTVGGMESLARGGDASGDTMKSAAIGGAVQAVLPAGLKAATKIGSGTKSALAYVSKKLHGELSDETKAIIDEAPSVARVIQNGIGSVAQKSKDFIGKLQQKLDEGAQKVAAFTPEEDAVIAGSDIRQSFLNLIGETSQQVKAAAESKAGVAKSEVYKKLQELATAGQLTGAALTDQYRAKIAPVMAKIGGEKVAIGGAIEQFMGAMTDAKQVINGKLVDLADSGKKVSYLNGAIEAMKGNPTFAKVNGFKTALGRTIDWSSDEPAQMAMKDLYNGLRTELTGKASENGFELSSLFGEYQDGLKIVNGFKSVFNKANTKDPIGSLSRLGEKIREEWGQNGKTALFSPETQQAVKATFYQAKEAATNLSIANNEKLSGSLIKLVKGEGDQTHLAKLVESLGAKEKLNQVVQQLPLAEEAKQLLRDPFNQKLIESVRQTVKEQTPLAMEAFNSALSKMQQLRSANKLPKATRMTFEQLKASGMKQEWIDQFEGVASMVPEFNALLHEDRLAQLAKSPLLKDTMVDQMFSMGTKFGVAGALASLNPKHAAMALGAAVLKTAMSNPAKLAVAAEKSKQFGVGRQLEMTLNKISYLNDKVFPLVYGTAKNNQSDVNAATSQVGDAIMGLGQQAQ